MALIDTLKAVGTTPVSGRRLPVAFEVLAAKSYSGLGLAPCADAGKRANPMVSCLMATNGDRDTLSHALECYRRQLYANRELVIVTHPEGLEAVTELVRRSGAANVAIHCVGREMTLGDCRNLSIARSLGDIVMQWDDDDLYDPLRITVAVRLLLRSEASAVMLSRVVIWWPQRELAAISESRCWEGSIAVWREHAPVYPSLARGEDTFAVQCLAGTRSIALYDLPLLYVYTVHARNTWDTRHFEETLERAEQVFRGEDYLALIRLLSERAPMLAYQADLAVAQPVARCRFEPSAADALGVV